MTSTDWSLRCRCPEHMVPCRTEPGPGEIAVTFEPDGGGPAIPVPTDAIEEI